MSSANQKAFGTCFVIMPFGGNYDRYYRNVYMPAVEAAGYACQRADDIFGPGSVMQDVWTATQSAAVVLADVTGRNANVFYELGLAHASGKPVVIISSNDDDIPFDISHLRQIRYDKEDERWGAAFSESIQEALSDISRNPRKTIPVFLRPIGPAAASLSDRQRSIVGRWAGTGADIYVENSAMSMAMKMEGTLELNESQIVGAFNVIPDPKGPYESVALSCNGEFYNDDLFELIYRSRVRKQYGAMVVRLDASADVLEGHYAGFSPTRGCFVMGSFTLAREK